MSLDADALVDRRRMRRKLTFWRVLAVLVAVAGVVAVATALRGRADLGFGGPGSAQIARVSIKGVIRNDQDRVEALERLAKSRAARAVIVHIDSPGGTTAGSEQLHTALRKVAETKPTVVVVDGMAASGGYIAAMAADHIVAQGNSIVGSIGVLFQYPNVADLMKTIGIKLEEVKSSPLKAAPNGFEPTSPEARAAIAALVADSYDWFRGMVKERRGIDGELLARVTDGRVFTGRQGVELKLVDAIGTEETAVAWLAKQKGIDPKLPVRDWKLEARLGDLSFLHLGSTALAEAVGLGPLARALVGTGTIQSFERLSLDGLLALWHPAASD
ncbi:signal peptide peptidase SppA [Rhodoplanes sp. TEM]|uniref:Signal peptide peptidase SppA n=1 Tax=Rhodoplanes tepidamans TaxID=200616 RepID=A0ABT5JBR4_RHOTP|nr:MULTISPECIES: signal peptide peptidase SppA [Rhodoplanes]MDC7787125.1 signal peptide peptidase SppA [Rhodoplanes tepidamans]MDC7986811.1 signal peptide peptidase SppA [Rhodoplanes sp. TEM]MDQ0358726.1 protease-4 [Rhodoplanes tepidamans]